MENDDEQIGRALAENVFIAGDLSVQESIGEGLGVQAKVLTGVGYHAGVAIGEETEDAGGWVFLVQEKVVFDEAGEFDGWGNLHGIVKVNLFPGRAISGLLVPESLETREFF